MLSIIKLLKSHRLWKLKSRHLHTLKLFQTGVVFLLNTCDSLIHMAEQTADGSQPVKNTVSSAIYNILCSTEERKKHWFEKKNFREIFFWVHCPLC